MNEEQREVAERLADELQRFDGAERESLRDEASALLRKLAAEPVARPPTPVGWSDTDWIKHLECSPPIGYAMRDHLYGTSKAGVLRFCPSTEIGAFAVYAAPQQRVPLTPFTDLQAERLYQNIKPSQQQDARSCAAFKRLVRVVEAAHGIGEEA